MTKVKLAKCHILRITATASCVYMFSIFLLVVCLGTCRIASAQQDVGYILGNVNDQSGRVIAGAKITITQMSTGITQSVTSNDLGYYISKPLQVGQYSVLAEDQGFASAVVQNITVDAAAHVQANLVLRVGSVAATVTVEATPPIMDTTDAQLSTTVDQRAASQLPVNGRSVLALATLTPGVVSAVGAVSEGFENRGTAVSAIRIAGGAPGFNNNLLDGVSNMQDWLGEVAINIKSDAVQEFSIMSGVIPAQFGYTSGGVINVISRAGSNTIHGSVYEFFRNDALDAEQAWPKPQYGKQELRYNNYGGTLGGPLMRNKLFLFGNYEQYNFASKVPAYYTVPTVQERSGDFSDLGQVINGVCQPLNIYDSSNIVNNQRQQFSYQGVANKIDPSRLDPVAIAYQNMFYPTPNNTSGSYNACTHSNNFLYSSPQLSTERQGLVRSDYKLREGDSLVARYAYYLNTMNNGSGGFPGGVYSNRYDSLGTQDLMLSEIHVFSPKLVNDARISGMRGTFPYQAGTYGMNIAGKIGLPNDTPTVAPVMSNGVTSANSSGGYRASTTIEGIDDVTWTLPKHTLHIGASVRFAEGYDNGSPAVSGTFNFSSVTTGQGNDTNITSGTGNTYAAYLLGQVRSASQNIVKGTDWRRMMYAIYIHDDWRVTPRLTVNAGMRWDYMSQAVEKGNGLENFDITRTNPLNGFAGAVEYATVDGAGRNFVAENYGDYGPRLGAAYALTKDYKTVLRGGVGIYYPSLAMATYDQSSGNVAGFATYTTNWNATTTEGYYFQLKNGFPSAPIAPLGVNGGQNAFLGQSAAYVDGSAKDPSAQEFVLTLSRELPSKWVADLSYTGNRGNHFLNASSNINTLSPQYYAMGTAALTAQVPNPLAGKVPGSLGAATLPESTVLLPYPHMSSVTLQNPRTATYNANYGMLSLNRRTSHGLQIMGAYTFGKILDEGVLGLSDASAVGTNTANGFQNWRNPHGDYSVDRIDVTHRFTVSGLYNLPFGTGQQFLSSGSLLSHIVSGWQYNIIMTLESGRPIGIGGANNHLAGRPNWDPNVSVHVKHPSRSVLYKTGQLEWFNPLAFVNPADWTFGNVPRQTSNLRAPGTENFDMSLFKTTNITERLKLELRIEAFNALNHVNLGSPNAGFSAGPPAVASNPYEEGGHNTSSTFGMIQSTGAPRNVQLAAKLIF